MADNILTKDRAAADIALAAKDVAGVLYPRNILADPAGVDISPLTNTELRLTPLDVLAWNVSSATLNGTAAALNADAVSVDCSQYRLLNVQITGTFVGTLSFQVSNDGVNWNLKSALPVVGGLVVSTANAVGQWMIQTDGAKFVRVRMTSFTSGSATVTVLASQMPSNPVVQTVLLSGTATVTQLVNAASIADGLAVNSTTRVGSDNLMFNGTTWDRQRGNLNVLTGDTGAKTVTGNGATQVNYNAAGAYITVNMGAVTGTSPTLDMKVQISTDGGTTWVDLPGAVFPQFTTTGAKTLLIYPSATPVANSAVSAPLPRSWRVVWAVAGTTPSFTITNVQVAYVN